MLGFATAKRVDELGRHAFFSEQNTDLPLGRSLILQGDDLAPQFGFVGARYPSARILLIGINPGNGGNNTNRIAEDSRMMPAILRFARTPTEQNFVEATRAYMNECQSWKVWKRYCSEVIGAGKLSFDEIAYSNCLPWRTHSKSGFSDTVARKAATLYVRPFIEELRPSLIVAMGKERVPAILQMTGLSLPPVIPWNRSQAATAAAKHERDNAAAKILKFVNERRGAVGAPHL
jgi:uracil-DNA glycosylase